MLPLSGEKPVLDFSAYSTAYNTSVTTNDRPSLSRPLSQAEAPRRRMFAGIEIPGVRGLRGHEAERWRRGMGFDFELTNAEDKPEVLMDPWGCSLAGKHTSKESEAPEALEADGPQFSQERLPPKRMPAPPRVPLKAMPPPPPPKAMPAMPVPPAMANPLSPPKSQPPGHLLTNHPSREESGQSSHTEPRVGETTGGANAISEPSALVKAKAMPRKPEGDGFASGSKEAGFTSTGASQVPQPPESCAGLADLPKLLEEGQDRDDEAAEEELPKKAAQTKAAAAAVAFSPMNALMGLEQQDNDLLRRQMNIVREMAGGSKFHDPARDPSAYRKQAQNMCLIEVSQLKFCHKDIGQRFTHGRHRGQPVLKLLEELHARRVDAEELPPLVVMRKENTLQVVCGNRRLYCLKRYALEASRAVNVWCVVYDLKSKETPRPLVFKYILATTTEDSDRISARQR